MGFFSRPAGIALALGACGLLMSRSYRSARGAAGHRTGTRRVAMFNHYAKTHDMPGGTRHIELAELLRDQGWEATIFATPYSLKTAQLERPVSWRRPAIEREEQGASFVWLYTTPYAGNGVTRYLNMLTYLPVAALAGAAKPRPDVVIGSSPHLPAAFAAWLVALRHRAPFVLEVRDLWPDSLIQLGLTNQAVILPLRGIEWFLYRRAAAIIALTEGIQSGITAKGINAEKVALIPNGARRPAPIDDAERLAERQRLDWNDKTVAVWMGAHNPANGLEFLVDAARKLRHRDDLLIVFIGDGSDKPKLMARAADLPNVRFLDQVPKDRVSPILRAADIGLLHSRAFEAFTGARPNKLFDYMAAGLPVICAIPGEALRLVESARAGVGAEWENPTSIARGIELLADDQSRRRLGINGHEQVLREHSREASANALGALLNDVSRSSAAEPSRSPEIEVRYA